MNTEEINQKLRELAAARHDDAECNKALATMRNELETSQAWLFAQATRSAAVEMAAKIEKELRDYAVETYMNQDDPDIKKVHPALGIRMITALKYAKEQALAWALDHKLCLALDTKAFEKLAKDNPLDFVTVEHTPTATIATDLSQYLE